MGEARKLDAAVLSWTSHLCEAWWIRQSGIQHERRGCSVLLHRRGRPRERVLARGDGALLGVALAPLWALLWGQERRLQAARRPEQSELQCSESRGRHGLLLRVCSHG